MKKATEYLGPMIPYNASQLILLVKDFPAYFEKGISNDKMSNWNMFQDINLAAQAPIKFTEQSFDVKIYHIFDYFFKVLNSGVE